MPIETLFYEIGVLSDPNPNDDRHRDGQRKNSLDRRVNPTIIQRVPERREEERRLAPTRRVWPDRRVTTCYTCHIPDRRSGNERRKLEEDVKKQNLAN